MLFSFYCKEEVKSLIQCILEDSEENILSTIFHEMYMIS